MATSFAYVGYGPNGSGGTHTPLLNNQELLDASVPDFALPAVIETSSDRSVDMVLASFVLFYTVLQESRLATSVHPIGILIVLFALYATMTALQERIRAVASEAGFRRLVLGKVLLRLLYLAVIYLGGLFVRLVSDPLINGARRKVFSLIGLAQPIVLVIVLVCFLAQISMLEQNRPDIDAAIMHEEQTTV